MLTVQRYKVFLKRASRIVKFESNICRNQNFLVSLQLVMDLARFLLQSVFYIVKKTQ